MPKPERGSLNIVKKKPLPDLVPPPAAELEKVLLPAEPVKPDVNPVVKPNVNTNVKQDVQQVSITVNLDSFAKTQTNTTPKTVTYRLPEDLVNELIRKAGANDCTQTDIVAAALRAYLAAIPESSKL